MQSFFHIFYVIKAHWKSRHGKVLFVISAGWCFSVGVRVVYPVMLPYIQTAYDLTLSSAGLLLSVLWLAYATGQLPGGLLADQIGERIVLSIGMIIAGGALTVVVLSKWSPILYFGTALFGFSIALLGTVRLSVISGIYPNQRGSAIGVVSAAGDIGNSLLPIIAGLIASSISWRFSFGFAVPVFALVGIGFWFVIPTSAAEKKKINPNSLTKKIRNILLMLQQPKISYGIVIQVIGTSIYQAFTGFYPTYLVEIKGMSVAVASSLFALFFGVGVMIKPLSGAAFDRFGARQSLFILISVSGIGFILLPIVHNIWSLASVTIILGSMLGRSTIALSYLTDALPDHSLNTGLGTVRTTYQSVSAMSPVLFGAAASYGYFNEAFLSLSLISALLLCIIIKMPDL